MLCTYFLRKILKNSKSNMKCENVDIMYWIFVNCETLSEILNIKCKQENLHLFTNNRFFFGDYWFYYIIKKGFMSSIAGSKYDDNDMSNCGGNQNCKKKFHVIVCKWIPVSVP